jgi:carboxymethylenebutenolidase
MSAFLAKPKTDPRGGILVFHAWWGINDFTKAFCNRLANEGYVVLAPDLYNGAVAKTIPEAEKLRTKLKREPTSKLIFESLEQLQAEVNKKPIGLIGFSLGAYWGLWLVDEKPKTFAATVLFYSTRGMKCDETSSAFLGHFAETDQYVSDSGRKKLEKALTAAGGNVSFHVYPNTHHWFFENDRPEYNDQAAELAWKRTAGFLRTNLAEQSALY